MGYNDERLDAVSEDKEKMMELVGDTYDSMINQSDEFYQAQIDATKSWEEKQTQLQQERTDFTIEQIEQQKEQAHKDYTKEQSASYVDWQKQSNQYGANAESMASAGVTNSGYSESSQVNMYNTYQNRVATAREVYNRAVLNYNNSIKDAQLQNNSILAEIAFNSLYQQLEISLAGFQYKNELIINKLNTQIAVDNSYHSRYMDVLGQINTENSLAEQVRQFNEKMNFEKQQYNDALEQQKKTKSVNNTVNDSGGDDIKKTNEVKYTGIKVGSVLSSQQASLFGLNSSDKILYDGGAYYVEKGDNYVDITSIIGRNTTAPLSNYGASNSVLSSVYR